MRCGDHWGEGGGITGPFGNPHSVRIRDKCEYGALRGLTSSRSADGAAGASWVCLTAHTSPETVSAQSALRHTLLALGMFCAGMDRSAAMLVAPSRVRFRAQLDSGADPALSHGPWFPGAGASR